ncbi:transporter [Ganoderma sinense ZZ0214-1]|uniref:Transporter n=1 Tax=Ganoderma sinense ZZ0214-1 TaxID=1077348 RepID=A0A2G8S269_9APHY|nr:transporter [Ganoderma sinense ZZ0214-1]
MSRRIYPAVGSSQQSEGESLLSSATEPSDAAKQYGSVEVRTVTCADNERRSPVDAPTQKRQLGPTSAASLIFNRVIGTGIFATPSVILRSSGSVGLSLVMWLLGATVALCGTAVYMELGTALPRNGGEKNYLEFIFRRPRLLVTCIYAMYAVLTGWQAASCSVFGEYALHALDPERPPSPFMARLAGVLCITFALLLHGTALKAGLRLQNALGIFKILVLLAIALSGLASLFRVPGFELENPPKNFEWSTIWEGSVSGGANAFVTGLFNVIWCFIGYSNANYALAEVRDPVKTLKRAAPIAMLSVTLVYMLVNVAYYAVVDKADIVGSGRIAAALYFGRLWGVGAERSSPVLGMAAHIGCQRDHRVLDCWEHLGSIVYAWSRHVVPLPLLVALSLILGAVVQELGREGVLPFSSFFASNKPFNAPFGGLFEQWLVTTSIVLLVPPGDAYLVMLNLSSYPLALINMFISGGLLFIHLPGICLPKKLEALRASYDWRPPFRAWTPVVLFFFISNVFLVSVPLIPPARGYKVYVHLPYWLHVLVSWMISLGGVAYWYWWVVWLPRRGGYVLVRNWVRDDDGSTRRVIKKIKGATPDPSLDWSENYEYHPQPPTMPGVDHRRPHLNVEIPTSSPHAHHEEFLVGPSVPTPRHLRSPPFTSSFPSDFLLRSPGDADEDRDPGTDRAAELH